jgi:2-oxoglutarate dehydrogenase E2 component (dihydrolipoamide succinyltransferase)
MPTPVKVPSLGESVTSGILVQWLKEDGATVAKDEAICIIETDKANADMLAPVAGVIRHKRKAGETVPVGEVIGEIDESAAGAGAKAAGKSAAVGTSAPSAKGTVAAEDMSPAVRRMVDEHKLDAAALSKVAPGGRLTKEFLTSYVEKNAGNMMGSNGEKLAATMPDIQPSKGTTPPPGPIAPPAKGQGASERPNVDPNAPPKDFDANGQRRVKMTKIRQSIARRLVQAQQTAAILTTFNEVDLTEVMALRSRYKEQFEKTHGVGLGFMSFFARAVVMGLKEFPRVNAQIDGEDVVYNQAVNLGVAVSTDRGLAVPVLRNVQNMSFAQIENEIKRLAAAVRDNKLSIDELSGGTFSITNGGVFGSLLSTPILNPPQSGILGMHTIQKRPVVIADKIEIRPMMYLALSYDHRIVDGKEAISFLVRVKQSLEDPARLMLDI